MARKEISPEDKKFINEVIGPQLRNEKKTQIVLGLETYNIAYCHLQNPTPIFPSEVLVLVTGFGSGWTGIARLAYFLVKMGYNVACVSPLGYGNSDDPSYRLLESMRNSNDFILEAEALAKWAKKTFPNESLRWIGHSEGSPIITSIAYTHPDLVKSLTLLNPAGFEKRKPIELMAKFALNGLLHAWAFRGDPLWAQLKRFLPKENKAFAKDRRLQRLSEWLRLCKDATFGQLKALPPEIPFKYVTSDKDFVFPWNKSAIVSDYYTNSRTCRIALIEGSYHNTTMYQGKKTAEAISKFLGSLRR